MRRTAVLNVVGLTKDLIGPSTPKLAAWLGQGKSATIHAPTPAVTCTSQATYLTGEWPDMTGIVGNGWYFRDEAEVKFWRQSNALIQCPKIWDMARQIDPSFTCANMFWWYNMYSGADYGVTPRPMYPADGRKLPDVYSNPGTLRVDLQKELGTFPLFDFWGPRTSIKSSRWIADASKRVEEMHSPTLSLVYLPHLDYGLQKYGPADPRIQTDLKEIDALCGDLIDFYETRGVQVVVLSEYGITEVSKPVHINRALREAGLIAIREELGLDLLDPGASAAFAVADHQVAHVYVNKPEAMGRVRSILDSLPGIERVLDEKGKAEYHLDNPRSGDLVAIAEADAWFTYYYWLDDSRAPDFARTVDIHRKPGYDPVELFTNPEIKALPVQVGFKLLKKQLGFRYLMDVIPLDATLVKGSHGRVGAESNADPLIATRSHGLLSGDRVEAVDVCGILLKHLQDA